MLLILGVAGVVMIRGFFHPKRPDFIAIIGGQSKLGIELMRLGGRSSTLKAVMGLGGRQQRQRLDRIVRPANSNLRAQIFEVLRDGQPHALTLGRVDDLKQPCGERRFDPDRCWRMMVSMLPAAVRAFHRRQPAGIERYPCGVQ